MLPRFASASPSLTRWACNAASPRAASTAVSAGCAAAAAAAHQQPNGSPYDVIVLGTGAFGSSAAYHLSRQGARVLALDMHPPAHPWGSSHGHTRIIRLAYFEVGARCARPRGRMHPLVYHMILGAQLHGLPSHPLGFQY